MATLKPQWVFPVAALPADPRRSLPVFQVLPNWKDGITETLSWLTDVMSSEMAVEQRRALRRYPRRQFEMGFLRVGAARSRIENFLAGVGKRDHLVPIWHEQYKLGATPLPFGIVQFPTGTLAEREFDFNDLVLITTGDMDRYAVLTVTAVNKATDQIQMRSVADIGTWPVGSRIVPLRRSKVLDQSTLENVTDRAAMTRIRFQLQDADTRFTSSWGYCSPLWRTKPNRVSPLSMEFNRSDYVLDFSTGVVDVTDPGDRAQISQSMDITLFGRSQVWAFRAFLYNARGRARRFYVPTFMSDIEPAGDMGGLQFDAMPNGFSEYFAGPQQARRIIGVDFKDGRPSVYRNIVGVGKVLDVSPPFLPVVERFVLDQAMPPILRREVERVSFIVPSRFDQDTIELFHVTDDSAAVKSSVVTRSAIVDGMPPIECWVASRPYPLTPVEEMTSQAICMGGVIYDPRNVVTEEVNVSTQVVAGVLSALLKSVSYQEQIDVTARVVEGSITSPLRAYDAGLESLNVSTAVVGGTVQTKLITQVIPVESINVSAAVQQGSLT